MEPVRSGGWQMKIDMGRIRPQIFLALVILGMVSMYSIYGDRVKIATGTVGGMVALSMKVLEGD